MKTVTISPDESSLYRTFQEGHPVQVRVSISPGDEHEYDKGRTVRVVCDRQELEGRIVSLSDKRQFLWDQGRYVMTTDFYGARVKLFSLYTSFVEVYYHPVDKKVMRISIAGDQDLKKHLSNISVSF